MGIEADAFALADGLDGDDVPDVFGDDVADEEIDFFAGVDFAAGSGGFVAVAGLGVEGGGFDLDAKESVIEFDDGVVAVAVSPGEADAEAEVDGAGEEGGFGGFSDALAGGFGGGVKGDEWVLGRFHKRDASAKVKGVGQECPTHTSCLIGIKKAQPEGRALVFLSISIVSSWAG